MPLSITAGHQRGTVGNQKMMISFMEKTWLAWWVFAILVILRWFHALRSSETIERDLDHEETEKKSALAA